MPLCVDVHDVNGRRVTCDDATWTVHIVSRHPEMQGRLDWLREALQQPMGIYRSARDAYAEAFHRQYDFGPPNGRQFLRILVRYNPSGNGREGIVTTAFAADGPKRGEVLIWPAI